jgi:hypothetical protein
MEPRFEGVEVLDHFPWLYALITGFTINVADVGCTLMFAAKPWEAELRRQGLTPSPLTPPCYILTNFVGGLLLTIVYTQFAHSLAPGMWTAVIASLLVWLTTLESMAAVTWSWGKCRFASLC